MTNSKYEKLPFSNVQFDAVLRRGCRTPLCDLHCNQSPNEYRTMPKCPSFSDHFAQIPQQRMGFKFTGDVKIALDCNLEKKILN